MAKCNHGYSGLPMCFSGWYGSFRLSDEQIRQKRLFLQRTFFLSKALFLKYHYRKESVDWLTMSVKRRGLGGTRQCPCLQTCWI